jgi:uncharacterized protein (DUF427 family)
MEASVISPAGVARPGSRIQTTFWAEATPRRVRGYAGGHLIVDSKNTLVVYEKVPYPAYWFPLSDVRQEFLTAGETNSAGTTYWDLSVGGRTETRAARSVSGAEDERQVLNGYICFYWNKLDSWFEEDDEVFVHARDPYTRIDVLKSSRHIRVEVNGTTVADTTRPSLLFETRLPVRYYIPKVDCRMDLLIPSEKHTSCPYKGEASYWAVQTDQGLVPDVVWSYPRPISDCAKIENLLSFYNEKVDIYIDGDKEELPQTRS